ncbi:hypothetical protein [Actinomadura sp. 7K534]|uniref:hypothetical protein n=1 Tax=Actinomadura sp. 7K534 TaxID=2530366 RepID=UPI001052FDF2|nr:hypothetical protein [Actinomadura sp. 7K534]TDB97962.1 hypothetical protein E1266_05085 [Actinomadura sp. 7K534]
MLPGNSDDQLTLEAVAVLLTGLVKAFDLHADANPTRAFGLRAHADEVRNYRDDLLKMIGVAPGTALSNHGGHGEWTVTIGKLASDDSQWPLQPSRDPWSAAS